MRTRFLALPLALALASGVAVTPLMMRPAQAAVDIMINFAPPPLPVYEQPPLPGPGYMWTPGYWAYDPEDGYYWVPGTWVEPPQVGLLWTPGYWAFINGAYAWNAGYWGPTVGFYGGVDYGYGYNGRGFYGGRWERGHFAYNRAAWNIGNTRVTNVYNQRFERNTRANRVSFNGGNGGIDARPSPEQERARQERRVQATAMQTRQVEAARRDPQLRASANHGRPAIAATARPGDFKANPVAATNAADPNIGKRNAVEERRGERNATTPNVTRPGERNATTPNATRPGERNATTPTVTRPGERNATTPNAMRPGERNATTPNATRPGERNVERPNARPAERNTMTRPNETRPTRPENRGVMHPQPNAERPAVAHPTARPPVHPAPQARPAESRRPMAAPHEARPAARPAPQREDKKQP